MSDREALRLEALAQLGILDTRSSEEFDRITELAATIAGTPISLISLVDDRRQWIKSGFGIVETEIPRELAFCNYTIMQQNMFQVNDATKDSRFSSNPLVTGEPRLRFYAGFPLTDTSGNNIGTLSVLDYFPGELDYRQIRSMELLALEAYSLLVSARQREEIRNFEKLFSQSPDPIFIVDAEGMFKKANPALCELLGWQQIDLLSKSFYLFLHPDDRTFAAANVASIAKGAQFPSLELRVICADGNYRTIQWTLSPEPGTGNVFATGRDQTEQQANREKLLVSEARTRAFFENSQGLMCTHDLDGKFLSVNSAGASMLGYTVKQMLDRDLYALVPKDHWEGLEKYLQTIARDGSANGQMTTVHRDGSARIWMFSNVLQISNESEAYVIANAIDITERYELEKSLHRTKEMLEQTNKVARIGVWQLDLSSSELYWSNVTKEIHGVALDYQPNVDAGLEFYKPGESRETIKLALDHAIKTGVPWNLDLEIITMNGDSIWVRAIGTAVMKDGICRRLYGTFQDIDEKKRAQLEISRSRAVLAAFVKHVPVAVAMLDAKMSVIAASERWNVDYGPENSEMIGMDISLISLFSGKEWQKRFARVMMGTTERMAEDLLLLPGRSVPTFVEWQMLPWQQGGDIGGVMLILRDVTEDVRQREELTSAKALAEAASKAKSEFLANMSHEIRTPLNGVIGFTDLLAKTELSAVQRQYLGLVEQSAGTLISIINDILDFSKIEAGRLELNPEPMDIYELCAEVTDMLHLQLQDKGLEMLLDIDPELPSRIWADRLRLKQILINLLSNASKFTAKGEIELRVERLGILDRTLYLRFSVRDTGIGIKEEKQQLIMEAFAQEDGSTTKRYGGTGLGLSISAKLLEMMGSRMLLSSALGSGSVFSFELGVQFQDNLLDSNEGLGHIKKVLVVDDNANNREILRRMLGQRGIETVEVEGGGKALELFANGLQCQAVVMDYHMPEMDGLQAISKIREMFFPASAQLPIILLSSSSDNEKVTAACVRLDVSARLTKPVKSQQIFAALDGLYRKELPQANLPNIVNAIIQGEHNILVVEDNAINMMLSLAILKRIAPNSQIRRATDGVHAVRECLQHCPDLILMDVQMPEMNGLEATAEIRKNESKGCRVPIVALTASNVQSERDRCFEAGMDGFLAKPIIEAQLVEVLRHWLVEDQC